MSKRLDSTTCYHCGFSLIGLPINESRERCCPECGNRYDPISVRKLHLAKIRRRDRRQMRVLFSLCTIGVAVFAVLMVFIMITSSIA